jgi:predicted enzyme related to lactoylglutathione lyase
MSHPVVHFEIGCRDTARTQDFYSKLFDWNIKQAGPAAMIETGGSGGIIGHITSLGHEPHNFVTVYVQVDDIVAAIAKAQGLGGKKIVGPIDIPTGSFAWIADPEGTTIGLFKPSS